MTQSGRRVSTDQAPQSDRIMALAGMPDDAQSAAIKVAIAQPAIRTFLHK
jgi:hypothetical protein